MPGSLFSRLFGNSNTSGSQNKNARLICDVSETTKEFNPEFYELCYCGSEQLFSVCCGSTEPDRSPPQGVFLFENFVDDDFSNQLCEYADQMEGHRLTVIDNFKSTPNNIVKTADDRRVAERVVLGERQAELNQKIKTVFTDLAWQCYGKKLDWYESPDLMRYKEGGFYKRHADSQNMNVADRSWSKVIDRDISMLLYLNENYEGGELNFSKLNYRIRPRTGMLVMFPSDQRFLHQAEIVTKGVRYALVSWASVAGMPKIADSPPESAILIE